MEDALLPRYFPTYLLLPFSWLTSVFQHTFPLSSRKRQTHACCRAFTPVVTSSGNVHLPHILIGNSFFSGWSLVNMAAQVKSSLTTYLRFQFQYNTNDCMKIPWVLFYNLLIVCLFNLVIGLIRGKMCVCCSTFFSPRLTVLHT